jgi:hypothetical protein
LKKIAPEFDNLQAVTYLFCKQFPSASSAVHGSESACFRRLVDQAGLEFILLWPGM